MEALWFCIVLAVLAMYAILDGFDLGAGVIYLFVARTEAERRSVLSATGLIWDDRVANPRERRALDIAFGVGSILLALFLGTGVGFVMSGTVNWFVVLCGFCGLAVLTLQSAAWIALKSTGELQSRCRRLASHAWWAVLAGFAVVAAARLAVQPSILDNTLICAFVVLALAGLMGTRLCLNVAFDLGAFLSATCAIAGLLAGAAAAHAPGLRPSAMLCIPAFILAAGYNVIMRRSLPTSSDPRALASRMRDSAI